jgi:NADH-quinone oxidoreductase subunit C
VSEALQQLGEHISSAVSDRVNRFAVTFGNELTLMTDPAHIQPLLEYLRDDETCKFTQLIDITAVDYPERLQRFEVVYHLLSISNNQRVRIKLSVNETSAVPSAVPLFASAGWFEREVWDMYGIPFEGNPDLRRILTDYGFDGHPQRKDFPLTGYVELRYDEDEKRVVYEPVKMTQAYRSFDFLSPWEGPDYVPPALPGDEKAKAS